MKEKFIKSTIILVLGGLITKVLSMIIRIIGTRIIGVEGIGLYMLVLPTFNLFITIAVLSLPVAISKLVAEDVKNNKKIVFGIIPIALLFNVILIIIIILLAPIIANNLLHNNNLYYPIISIAFTLPFITLSSIIRGYFFGKQKMTPHVISHIFEQIIRIVLIVIITPLLLKKGIVYAVSSLILFNCISELASIIILMIFIPKHTKIKKDDFKLTFSYLKDILDISIPTTLGRIISSVGLFFEPIIITFVMLKLGSNNNIITLEYGIISGYVIAIVTMPSFLTGAISSALLPILSKYHVTNNKIQIKRKLKQALILSLIIGIPITISLFFFPSFFLKLLFNTSIGSDYLKVASIIFLFSYIIPPLSTTLQATDKSKKLMISNLISNISKAIILFALLFLNINMYALLISYFISFIFTIIYESMILKKYLN